MLQLMSEKVAADVPFMTPARFPNYWASRHALIQFLHNRRSYHNGSGRRKRPHEDIDMDGQHCKRIRVDDETGNHGESDFNDTPEW